jgi:hypothetical protein
MTLGLAPRQGDLWRSTVSFCADRVGWDSIYAVLHRDCFRLFPDSMFADLFTGVGRRSVPPMIVAVVMVLQRIEGLSDREAVDRFAFDARWKYAAGGLDFDHPEFVHTVLVDMRARLARSDRPDRIFQVTVEAARAAGLVGRKRVLDSTPLYDAVATMDTVTLLRSAIRGLLSVADAHLGVELRARLGRDDDYVTAGKPVCDFDDPAARKDLVDALAKDAYVLLDLLGGRRLDTGVEQAAVLLATVTGQDLDHDEAGVFTIARRVAKDRVISTVDPETRHGHKTAARGFDGYKGHIGIDPDSEIITATTVSAGNAGDAGAAEGLIADLLAENTADPDDDADAQVGDGHADQGHADEGHADDGHADDGQNTATVYGDNAYGTGEFQDRLEQAGIESKCKSQSPTAAGGLFTKDQFGIDLGVDTVTCPAGQIVSLRRGRDGGGSASFGAACTGCPLRSQCTTAAKGRSVKVGPHEAVLARARDRQRDPDWAADYRATRPKVERKIGHLMRRRHGGRRARMRGKTKIAADFAVLAAAVNLARLGVLTMITDPAQRCAAGAG